MSISLILLLAVGGLTIGSAASAIGIATARGSFHVDNATVSGNATLFDGALVETAAVGTVLELDRGVRMYLGSASRAKVYQDRFILERGEGQIQSTGRYEFEAGDLRILPASPEATARVALRGDNRVRVSALAGDLQVTTGSGTLVASLNPGKSLEFEPQAAGAAAPFRVSGCLQKQDGRFLLQDDTAAVTFELQGSGLGGVVGQRVEILGTNVTGAKPGPGASDVIRVVRVKRLAGNCVSPVSSGSKGGSKAGSSAKHSNRKAIIAGVAIAAAGAGTTLALIGEEEKPSISR